MKKRKPDKDLSKAFLELEVKEQKEVCMVFYERCTKPVTERDMSVARVIDELRLQRKVRAEKPLQQSQAGQIGQQE